MPNSSYVDGSKMLPQKYLNESGRIENLQYNVENTTCLLAKQQPCVKKNT
jgi:hypothetical protein